MLEVLKELKKVCPLVNFSEVNKENIQKIYTGLSRASDPQ